MWLCHWGSTTVSRYSNTKGWGRTGKKGCGPQEGQNQCHWDELTPPHHFARWRKVLLPWQGESNSHRNVQCSGTAPAGAQWLLGCSGPRSPREVHCPTVQWDHKPSTVLAGPWENERAWARRSHCQTSLSHHPGWPLPWLGGRLLQTAALSLSVI